MDLFRAERQTVEDMRSTERVKLVGASILQLPFNEGQFQRVYSYYLLPWLGNKNYHSAIDEMIRVADQEIGTVAYGPHKVSRRGSSSTVTLRAHDR
jgi:ubiquinone/menaquinone biosynthesis C-methylase UbiE